MPRDGRPIKYSVKRERITLDLPTPLIDAMDIASSDGRSAFVADMLSADPCIQAAQAGKLGPWALYELVGREGAFVGTVPNGGWRLILTARGHHPTMPAFTLELQRADEDEWVDDGAEHFARVREVDEFLAGSTPFGWNQIPSWVAWDGK